MLLIHHQSNFLVHRALNLSTTDSLLLSDKLPVALVTSVYVPLQRLTFAIACSIEVAGIAVSIALNTSALRILGDKRRKFFKMHLLDFHFWKQYPTYNYLSLN